MPSDLLISHIKASLNQGASPRATAGALTKAGWSKSEIISAFRIIFSPTPLPLVNIPNSDTQIVTETDYPISKLWIIKAPLIMILISVVALFFNVYFPYFLIAIPFYLIANPLIRRNFHYATEAKFLMVKQGIIAKKQRNLPYGVIQHVFVKQDLFDRVFGLATLAVENASQGGGKGFFGRNNQREQGDVVGSIGNKINIPGLHKPDAEALKEVILQKMKANPVETNQSGL